METGFTYSLDNIKRVSGSIPKDFEIISTAERELLEFVEKQYNIVNNFTELHQVMTIQDEVTLKNCIIAINHILKEAKELKSFFSNLNIPTSTEPFELCVLKIEQLLKNSEDEVNLLFSYI